MTPPAARADLHAADEAVEVGHLSEHVVRDEEIRSGARGGEPRRDLGTEELHQCGDAVLRCD